MMDVVGLYRYALKGFPGEALDDVTLRADEGIPGDRVIGIATGSAGSAFHQLTTQPKLARYNPAVDGLKIRLFGAAGSPRSDILSDATLLEKEFGTASRAIARTDSLGHWDFPDSTISIINVETVKALSAAADTDLDPMRFRANIYVSAEPFSELGWLGSGLWVGDSQLSVIRPMRRCSATSVNPVTGERDINVPAQLMKHFGHLFFGVYANVERSGHVEIGSAVRSSNVAFSEKLPAAARVAKAPPLAHWPRPAIISAVKDEAEDIRSLWLEDPLARIGALDEFQPGQHLALHSLSSKGDWRRYTISGKCDGRLRITVRRDKGVGSNFLHRVKPGQSISISGPFGADTLNTDRPALMFLSAGIGITPSVTKLEELSRSKYSHPVHIIHVARSQRDLALWNEVTSMAEGQPNWKTSLYLTQDNEGMPGAIKGRPDIEELMHKACNLGADIHLCGPPEFQKDVQAASDRAGLPTERVFIDAFFSPNAAADFLPVPASGPFLVHFRVSGFSAEWKPEDGPLLDFAESHGLTLPAHCRAGLCNTCRCKLAKGSAKSLVEGADPSENQTLLCCSVPASDIELEC